MGLPTGDVVIDFTQLANTNPYLPANFTQVDSGNFQILSASLKPSGFNGVQRLVYNGSMLNPATTTYWSRVEVGVAHVSDLIYAFLVSVTGAGYALFINNGSLSLNTITGGSSPTTGGLVSTSVGAVNPADVFDFTIVKSGATNLLTVYQNGTMVLQTTDNTYPIVTSALSFGFGFDAGNNNTSTMLGFAGIGIAAAPGATSYYLGGTMEF